MKLHNIFLEQTSSDLRAVPTSPSSVVQLDDPNYKGKRRGEFNLDTHTTLEVVELVSVFFPPIGTVISVAAGLANAALYAEEGDNYNAGLGIMFSVLPVIGPIVNKIPGLKTWSKKALITLGEKIKLKQALTKSEKLLVDELTLNKDFIKTEVNKLIVKGKDKILRSPLDAGTKQIILTTAEKGGDLAKLGGKIVNKTLKTTAKITKTLGPGVAAYYGYDKTYKAIQSDKPEVVAEELGLTLQDLRYYFGSTGSENDDKLMVQAVKSGWTPGDDIPEKFLTTKAKKDLETQKELKKILSGK